jgi:hypothetical protein
MTLVSPILRSLLIYVMCLPLAIVMGYALATPLGYGTLGVYVMVAMLLALPLVLRWHHHMLLLFWNSTALVFLIPGRPSVWFVLAIVSLLLSLTRRAVTRSMRLLNVPALTWPLCFLVLVILVTANLTGGLGFRAFGSEDVVGGKRYVLLLAAVLGYFAISVAAIPPERARLAASLYFAGGLSAAVGSLIFFIDPALQYIYLFFPTDTGWSEFAEQRMTRFYGVSVAAQFGVMLLLVRYGLRGIFLEGKWWRSALLVAALIMGLFGGFRTVLITFGLLLLLQFILEGLLRTKLIILVGFAMVMGGVLVASLAPYLPPQVQRCFTFLPQELVQLDAAVRLDAEHSTRWRVDMWQTVLPQVPQHLLLGRGYGIDRSELELSGGAMRSGLAQLYERSVLAGDFHSGPLSILVPLGIWGGLAFLWLSWVGVRSLYRNYLYSPPELKLINTLLLSSFLTQLAVFVFIFGSFQTQLPAFTGLLALSVAINGGVRSSVPLPAEPEEPPPLQVFRLPKPLSGG